MGVLLPPIACIDRHIPACGGAVMGRHALLSASSSHRWLNCPPSARLCEGYEDKKSEYAQEGTDAHSLCEHKLKLALGMEIADPTDSFSFYDEEMEEYACGYAAYVMDKLFQAGGFAMQILQEKFCLQFYLQVRLKFQHRRDFLSVQKCHADSYHRHKALEFFPPYRQHFDCICQLSAVHIHRFYHGEF